MSLLVANESSIRRSRSINAVFPAGFPKHFIAAEKGQVDSSIAGGFHVGALRAGPIFIVADRHEEFVVGNQVATAVAVDAGEIADVVTVSFQPAHHRIFDVEQPILAVIHAARVKRPVVAQLVSATGGRSRIKTVAAIRVVSLPSGVGRLKQDIGGTGVVAHDERDMACPAGVGAVLANRFGKIDSRHRILRHRPSG